MDVNDPNQKDWICRFIGLPRRVKRLILLFADLVLLSVAMWLAISARLSELYVPPDLSFGILLAAAPVITVSVFFGAGLYRLVTRYISLEGTFRIFAAVGVSVLIWGLLILLTGITGVPRSVILSYGLLGAVLVASSRHVAGWVLNRFYNVRFASFDDTRRPVLIYGAGEAGLQLAVALKSNADYRTIAFIDEDENMRRQVAHGYKVYGPEKLEKLIERKNVRDIFVSLPDISRRKRQSIVRSLEKHSVTVRALPAITDIATGKVRVSDLRPIEVEELLGRIRVPPKPELLMRNVRDRSVLITGAGGSIGSELTQQVLRLRPKRLVLLEQSEVALYEIEQTLKAIIAEEIKGRQITLAPTSVEIIPVLGSVLDEKRVDKILELNGVETVFHAAAYKHVPIVEENPAVGLRNNTLGTDVLARSARRNGVKSFTLISTDKAVRPTNVMGASKRLAELVLQGHALDPQCETVFTMVRFGNVLGSSGSVVPAFRKQIEKGGPVTVTHPDMTRYFMAIPEAAELVIQASALATGGDVFVLDMGEPVKIDDLARLMINLTGLAVLDDQNPSGDIEINYVGLRPGEKLREELLIGDNVSGTEHPRILMCHEPALNFEDMQSLIGKLRKSIERNDVEQMTSLLCSHVEGYRPDAGLVAATDAAQEGQLTAG